MLVVLHHIHLKHKKKQGDVEKNPHWERGRDYFEDFGPPDRSWQHQKLDRFGKHAGSVTLISKVSWHQKLSFKISAEEEQPSKNMWRTCKCMRDSILLMLNPASFQSTKKIYQFIFETFWNHQASLPVGVSFYYLIIKLTIFPMLFPERPRHFAAHFLAVKLLAIRRAFGDAHHFLPREGLAWNQWNPWNQVEPPESQVEIRAWGDTWKNMGLSENVVYPYTQWFCWSLSRF